MPARYARLYPVVKAIHLDRWFDYAIPDGIAGGDQIRLGSAVRLHFHGMSTSGWVMEVATSTAIDPAQIKPIDAVVRTPPFFDPADAAAWRWVADRFGSTFAAVTRHAIPDRVKYVERELTQWPSPPAIPTQPWHDGGHITHLERGWHDDGRDAILTRIRAVVDAGYQAHIITPLPDCPISDAIQKAFGRMVLDLRGETQQSARYRGFWRWRTGQARILIGTRSSALWPGQTGAVGLIVLIDEANPAYKMPSAPRAHIRETALIRARTHHSEVLITSAVPSGQLTRLIAGGHVRVDKASRRQIETASPAIHMIDRNTLPIARRGRLAGPALDAITTVLNAGGRVIVLVAMKGTGRSIGCQRCKRRMACPACGAGLDTPDRQPIAQATQWQCGVCDWRGEPFACPHCSSTSYGFKRAGVTQISNELRKTFPHADITTMEGFNQPGPTTRPAIAVMTRGSVVASPTWLGGARAELAVIVDPDVLLGRPDYDATEDALRLWADTAHLAQRVIIQTYEPDHHAITAFSLINPGLFWDRELDRRAALHFPPAGHLIRLERMTQETVSTLCEALAEQSSVIVLGPDEDGSTLVTTPDLPTTLKNMRPIQEDWAKADTGIRMDVDPIHL
ncbi:hypothetical protein [Stomatohabitans albus]|uniref:primosomal protein N' family DNA-binding protein n=1 Tax=Stomatohabitans albus TaxID=3110766 RepID=UPI00300CA44A